MTSLDERAAYDKLAKAADKRDYQLSAVTSSWYEGKTRYVAYIAMSPFGAHGGIGTNACFTAMEAVDECIAEFRKLKEELQNEQQEEEYTGDDSSRESE